MAIFQKKCGECEWCTSGNDKCKTGTWYVDYYVNGRRKRETAPNKAMAEDLLHKRKTQIFENKFDIQKDCSLIFRDLSEKYLEYCKTSSKKSWERTDAVFIKHLNDHFGDILVKEISPEDIEAYKNNRKETIKNEKSEDKNKQKEKIKPSTVNHELSCLRLILNKAIYEWRDPENKRLPLFSGPNPASRFKRLRETTRERFLTKGELVKLFEVSSSELRDYILVAINTGMRKGELRGMRPEHVNLENNYIFLPDTKNGEKRYVPTNEIVKSVLSKLFNFAYNPRKAFETALRNAKIDNFVWHDLRHTFASYLAQLGVDLYTIAVLLGHKTRGGKYSITARYTHLQQDHLLEVVKKLDFFLKDIITVVKQVQETKVQNHEVIVKA